MATSQTKTHLSVLHLNDYPYTASSLDIKSIDRYGLTNMAPPSDNPPPFPMHQCAINSRTRICTPLIDPPIMLIPGFILSPTVCSCCVTPTRGMGGLGAIVLGDLELYGVGVLHKYYVW